MVGRVGPLVLAAGAYVYVGSAFGPGGVRARLAHHLRISKRPHWHIDYLRLYAEIDEIWFAETDQRLEHRWAARVANMDYCNPVMPGLGASDCRCATHLFYFAVAPEMSDFIAQVPQIPGSAHGYQMQRRQN